MKKAFKCNFYSFHLCSHSIPSIYLLADLKMSNILKNRTNKEIINLHLMTFLLSFYLSFIPKKVIM